MISLGIAVFALIIGLVVSKRVTEDNAKRIEKIALLMDEHSKLISEYKVLLANSVTMEQVDQKFITRDLFQQNEKHIDQRFQSLEKKIDSGFSEMKALLKKG